MLKKIFALNLSVFTVMFMSVFSGNAITDQDLVLHLNFEEGSGDTTVDLSGNGNDGILHNVEWTDGKSGSGVMFDGVAGTWVEVPDSDSLDSITEQITLMAWVYPTVFNNEWQRILNKCWAGDTAPWMIWGFYEQANSNGRLGFTLAVDGGQERLCRSGETPTIPADEWTHVAAVYDGETMKLYQNGEVVVESNAQGTIDTNDVPVAIGRNSEGNREHYQGSIDDVAVWRVALDESQILSAMEQIAPVEARGKLAVSWAQIKKDY